MMQKTSRDASLSAKIVLLFIGFAFGLMLLEAFLRFGGWAFLTIQHWNDSRPATGTDYKILCLGESTTAGTVNSQVSCWPGELELNLNNRRLKQAFIVINEGIPGTSLEKILARLDSLLDHYRPDLVIAMVGINDTTIDKKERTHWQRHFSMLENVRTVKLLKLIWHHWQTKFDRQDRTAARVAALPEPEKMPKPTEFPDKTAALSYFSNQINTYPESSHWYFAYAHYCLDYHDAITPNEPYDQFLVEQTGLNLLKALEKGPGEFEGMKIINSLQNYMEIIPIFAQDAVLAKMQDAVARGLPRNEYMVLALALWDLEKEDYAEAMPLLRQAIQVNPSNEFCHITLGRMYAQYIGDREQAEAHFKIAQALRLQSYAPNLQASYRQLVQKVTERKITLALMQYPLRSVQELKNYLPGFAHVLFVSNQENFAEALKTVHYEDLFIDHFAGDFGHCTKRGNQLIADHLSESLVEELGWR